ncbi:MAG: isoleucine--tRNA ligase [Bryobacterales bacterium]|nr:isoleucine--tRNA ligase [Bryobacterales bacterium]
MDSEQLDLKKTVNLPQTSFPMKANLPQAEPKMLDRWKAENLYGKIRTVSAGRPRYVLHDGPPYANGNIHLGHAFNKTLKDFIVKSKTMAGFDSPYVPGWDCHGLPIEIKVDGLLGSKKAKMSQAEIRRECRKYAAKYVELQKQDFIRLGVFGEWDRPYLTMSAEYQSVIARAFVDFLDKGYVYKGLKPVNWCLNCKTALAEAEVEYENHSSPSIWVRFALTSDPAAIDPALAGKHVYAVIWTTTPWTIPANMAICYHQNFEYVAVEVGEAVYIVAAELLKTTADIAGWADPKELARFTGARLEGAAFQHPFVDRTSPGILGDHVTLEQGTGAVHTAPGHGHEDYMVGLQYGIDIYCPVDAAGRLYHVDKPPYTEKQRLPEELIGKSVWDANPTVIDILKQHGALLAQKKIEHSYPHCWRCHKPTIFRGTEQWFIGMERNQLREKALESIRKIKWMPEWGEDRIYNMIATRPDWCISRQRVWGVPIVVFYCEDCGGMVTDRKVLDHVVDQFAEHTADVWYEKTANELAPAGTKCPKCASERLAKETDILDVWFDSGSSHLAVLNKKWDLTWPSDLYLEGGDQYRGWFHSSLLVGVGLKGEAPYRECATNGWTLDGEGRAMSKSLGNVIEPEKIIKQFGAEVLRLWVASVEFNEDVRLSDTILTRLTEAYRKMRNTLRYALGNLSDFNPTTDALPAGELLEIDQWILTRAEQLVTTVRKFYEDFAFHRAYQAFYNFATTDLSSLYFDVLKDRLYTAAPKSIARRSAQTAMWRITDALLRLMAPVLTFTTEEAWLVFPKKEGEPGSVHLALFPEPSDLTSGLNASHRARLANWDKLVAVRETVNKSLEMARQEKFIGAPLEAKVRLKAGSDLLPLLEQYRKDLPALFITSQVVVEGQADGADLSVHVERADGTKCERCWKYTLDVGSNARRPTVCAACASAVNEIVGGQPNA